MTVSPDESDQSADARRRGRRARTSDVVIAFAIVAVAAITLYFAFGMPGMDHGTPAVGAILMSVSTIVVALNAQTLRRVRLNPQSSA